MDTHRNYSSSRFIEWEGNGENFLISIASFATTSFAFSLVFFIVCRIIFGLLFRFRVSLIFRPYSFWPFLLFFVMEGNLQAVTFYACSIIRLCFFYNPRGKLQAAAIYFFLYLLVIFGVGGYFLIFQKLKSLSKYFADNVTPSLRTTAFLTFEYGVKNILLALIHSLLRSAGMLSLIHI